MALTNRLREARERLGLTQEELGDRAGVTRQAILAIEAGRRVPSTELAFRLARACGCSVEDLFGLSDEAGDAMAVLLAPPSHGSEEDRMAQSSRVAVGRVSGWWVAHRLPAHGSGAADAILTRRTGSNRALVDPLVPPDQLERNALVAGCAPLLATLADRVDARFGDVRLNWLEASSRDALDLLGKGLVHIAGVHPSGEPGDDTESIVRRLFPDRRMLIVNLTRWRQGFVVAEGNPHAIRSVEDLMDRELRFAGRAPGAGATKLLHRLVTEAGGDPAALGGPVAEGHLDVGRMVRFGAADVGVAIENAALSTGLDFVPLSEERFDLIVPAEMAELPSVAKALDALDDSSFRAEIDQLPGYDSSISGHATTLDAA